MKVKELVDKGTIGNVINVQIRFAQPPRDLDYNRENLPGVYRPILPEEDTSMTSHHTRSTFCRRCSAAYSEASGYKATVADSIRQKIH